MGCHAGQISTQSHGVAAKQPFRGWACGRSPANNTVIVGVGPQKAKWRCLVKNGRVADVMSLTDEGGL